MFKLRKLKPHHYVMAIALGLVFAWFGDDEDEVDSSTAPVALAPGAAGAGAVPEMPPLPSALQAFIPTVQAAPESAGKGMQQVAIMDERGFERPLPAFFLQVPEGWQTQSELNWNMGNDCLLLQFSARFRAISPDGQQVFEILPAWYSKAVSPQGMSGLPQGCSAMPLRGVRDYLEHVARLRHPDGRVLDYADRADLVQATDARNPLMQVPAIPTFSLRQYREAGQVLVGWNEQGRPMREVIAAMALMAHEKWDHSSVMMGMAVPGMMPLKDEALGMTVHGTVAYRAPAGQLDMALMERIGDSLQPAPEWGERVARLNQERMEATSQTMTANHKRRMSDIAAAGAANTAIHEGRMAAMDSQYNAWRNSQAASENSQRRTIDGIYENNSYYGVDGRPVQHSIHGGARVFQSTTNPGQVISTDDPYASPPPGFVELQQMR